MNDTRAASGGRAPWHLWLVGVLMVVWNAGSCVSHVMTLTQNAAYFRAGGITPEMAAYFAAVPAWYVVAWTIAVWVGWLRRRVCYGIARPRNGGVMRVGSLLVFLGGAAGLQACVPWPSHVTVAPEIVGVVREAGQPLTGAAIYYAHGYTKQGTDCTGIEVAATTDLEGRFAFEEVKAFRFFLTSADPIYPYIICVERGGQPVLLWTSQEMGYVLTPVELECELTGPIHEGRAAVGPCTVRYPTTWNQ